MGASPVRFITEVGDIVSEWSELPEDIKLKAVLVDVVTLGMLPTAPCIEFSGYDKYMFQKWALFGVGANGGAVNQQGFSLPFAGFQVGGYKEGIGWVVLEVDIYNRTMTVTLQPSITSTAIKPGVTQ